MADRNDCEHQQPVEDELAEHPQLLLQENDPLQSTLQPVEDVLQEHPQLLLRGNDPLESTLQVAHRSDCEHQSVEGERELPQLFEENESLASIRRSNPLTYYCAAFFSLVLGFHLLLLILMVILVRPQTQVFSVKDLKVLELVNKTCGKPTLAVAMEAVLVNPNEWFEVSMYPPSIEAVLPLPVGLYNLPLTAGDIRINQPACNSTSMRWEFTDQFCSDYGLEAIYPDDKVNNSILSFVVSYYYQLVPTVGSSAFKNLKSPLMKNKISCVSPFLGH